MGNQSLSVDFVTQLPPEVLSVVLSFLPLHDILECMRVCRRWHEVLSHLEHYWNSMLLGLGLPQSSLVKYGENFPHKKELFFDINRHLKELEAVEFVSTPAVCYPHYHVTGCFVMLQQGIVVRIVDRDHVTHLQVERLLVTGGVVSTQSLCLKELTGNSPVVVWGHYSKSGCLYWVDSARMVTCCDTTGKEVVHTFDLLKHLPCSSCDEKQGGVGEGSSIPSDAVMTCCEECSLCVLCWENLQGEEVAGEVETYDSFSVRVISLGDYKTTPIKLSSLEISCKHHYYHNHLQGREHGRVPRHRSSQVISTSRLFHEAGSGSICQSHSALVWDGDHCVLIVLVRTENEGNERTPSQTALGISFECLSCRYQLAGISGNMIMSLGGGNESMLMIGCVAQNHLCIWTGRRKGEISDDQEGLVRLVSKAELVCFQYRDEHSSSVQDVMEVVSVGEQLCIVWHQKTVDINSTIDDNLYIVHTESGKLFKQIKRWIPNHLKFSRSGSCIHHYLVSKETQGWLQDIRIPPPPLLLTVLLSDSERFGFLSVQQKQLTEQQQKHWVYAVNSCFRK